MCQIRPLHSFLIKLRSVHIINRYNGVNSADFQSNSGRNAANLIYYYTRETVKPQHTRRIGIQRLDAGLLSLVPQRFVSIKPVARERFAAIGVVKYLDDVETLLMKQQEDHETKSIDLDLFCLTFYRLIKLNEVCKNQIVKTCGLERMINLLKMIVERPEKILSAKSLEVLCHGISKLNATLEDESTKDRLVILMKSVVSPLLSRIFATEPSATPGELLGRGINRISEIIGDNLSNEEKSKIAHFVWKEFQKIIASNAEQGDVYIALLQMADLFVKLDIDEEKDVQFNFFQAESFLWVDSFLKRWIHCVQYDLMKFSRMQALMHLNFVLIALKNGKYDIIHEQKRRWSNVLRGTKSFINDKQMEKLKKYVGQIPVTNELYENLVEEFNLLLK